VAVLRRIRSLQIHAGKKAGGRVAPLMAHSPVLFWVNPLLGLPVVVRT